MHEPHTRPAVACMVAAEVCQVEGHRKERERAREESADVDVDLCVCVCEGKRIASVLKAGVTIKTKMGQPDTDTGPCRLLRLRWWWRWGAAPGRIFLVFGGTR